MLPGILASLFWPTREMPSETWKAEYEEACKIAEVHNIKRKCKQRELAQQKTVHVKQYYRRKPKRKRG